MFGDSGRRLDHWATLCIPYFLASQPASQQAIWLDESIITVPSFAISFLCHPPPTPASFRRLQHFTCHLLLTMVNTIHIFIHTNTKKRKECMEVF